MGETHLYYFIRGPLLWIAFFVFVGGIVFRTIQFFYLTRKKDSLIYFPTKDQEERYGRGSVQEREMQFAVSLKNSILGQHQAVAIFTFFFHILIFILPIFLFAHNLLLYESWNFSLWSFSESMGDKLTVLFLILALFFLVRRVVVSKVRALSRTSDYLVWLIIVAPFVTGFICYRQWFDYQTVLIIHMLSGALMLVSITFTKLGHMIFFFLARFLIGSEFCLGRGTRTW
jgi:nitrate reductase gamma subunit